MTTHLFSELKHFNGTITVGQWINCSLYNMGLGVICQIDDHVNNGMSTVSREGVDVVRTGGYVHVVFLTGRRATFSEYLLRQGEQYALVNQPIASDETLSQLVDQAQRMAEQLASDKKRLSEMHAEEIAGLRVNEQLTHLTQVEERYAPASKVAKNLRVELKRAFSGIKFKVTSSGRIATISWVDGVTEQQVKDCLGRYVCNSYDTMSNGFQTRITPWMEVFGSVDSLRLQREFTDRLIEHAIDHVCEAHNALPVDVAEYRSGRLYQQRFDDCEAYSVHQLIRLHLLKHAVA